MFNVFFQWFVKVFWMINYRNILYFPLISFPKNVQLYCQAVLLKIVEDWKKALDNSSTQCLSLIRAPSMRSSRPSMYLVDYEIPSISPWSQLHLWIPSYQYLHNNLYLSFIFLSCRIINITHGHHILSGITFYARLDVLQSFHYIMYNLNLLLVR